MIKFTYHFNQVIPGALDKETMDMMNMPRCGVPDHDAQFEEDDQAPKIAKRRFKRYQLQGSVWNTDKLTWKFTHHSKRSTLVGREAEVESTMRKAFEVS